MLEQRTNRHGSRRMSGRAKRHWQWLVRRLCAATLLSGSLSTFAQLNLPYNGSANSSSTLFQITQHGTGNGAAFYLNNSNASGYALFVQTTAPGPTIYGKSLATSGFTYGARFEATGSQARGVLGYALSTAGASYGVYGLSDSVAGSGVFGWARATTGTTYGVYGRSDSPSGYGGYFVGRGYFSGNVGIGTGSPESRLHVIAGSAGAVTADANSVLTLEHSARAYLSILTPNGNERGILFGQPSSNVAGGIIYNNSDTPNGLQFRTNGNTTRMVINGSGNVGIGTTNPQARLHVMGDAYLTSGTTTLQILPGRLFDSSRQGAATLEIPGNGTIGVWDSLSVMGNLHVGGSQITLGGGTDPSWSRVRIGLNDVGNSLYTGVIEALGANGNLNARITSITGYPNHGSVAVHDANGTVQAHMFIYNDGNGHVVADAKFFRTPDPDDPTRDIWYGCIEGPELAMYVRGTARLVNGRAHIELPDHFRKLADEQGMTVQLTPLSPASKGLCVLRKGLDGVEVAELMSGKGNYEFDWEVKAVRKEHRDYRVYRPWNEVMEAGEDPAKAWEARLKSIQDRQARQEPNR